MNKDLIAELRANHKLFSHNGQPTTYSLAADVIEAQDNALDHIATRVTPDDYDNPSSALESIGDSILSTGRTIEGME